MGSDDPMRGVVPTPTGARGGATRRFRGTSDVAAARARELHEQAAQAERRAAELRTQRDDLIRRLRAEDETRWSYGALATAIGCSRELIAQVIKRRGHATENDV